MSLFVWIALVAAEVALVVLIFRFLIAGISWLAGRKKTGTRKNLWTVVNCVFSVILIAFTLIPSFVFSNYNGLPTTGEYSVNEISGILVDSSRKDPFESDGSDREVPVHFYYPETDSAGSNAFPLIVFSHGAFGYYQSNFSTYMELASHGYVVVALDHPHHSFFTKDTAGKTVIVDTDFINDVMGINEEGVSNEQIFTLSQDWLQLRIADENFALDCIERAKIRKSLDASWNTENEETVLKILAMTDTDKIGLMGHSLGGASSVTLARQRTDIDAVVDLDGTMLGEIVGAENGKNIYNEETYNIPVLDFMKEKDYTEREQYKKENGTPYVNDYIIYTKNKVYETRQRLYELEELLREKHFLRVSKSMLLNLMKVGSIKPARGSRFIAVLRTGEEVVISRKFVPDLKKALKGE